MSGHALTRLDGELPNALAALDAVLDRRWVDTAVDLVEACCGASIAPSSVHLWCAREVHEFAWIAAARSST